MSGGPGDRLVAVPLPLPLPEPVAGAVGSPYVEFDRARWSALRAATPLTLDDDDLARLRGLGEPIDLTEVEDVYLPLSRLLNLQVMAAHERAYVTSVFLGERSAQLPFVVGVVESQWRGGPQRAPPLAVELEVRRRGGRDVARPGGGRWHGRGQHGDTLASEARFGAQGRSQVPTWTC
jgi:hypothetical protein